MASEALAVPDRTFDPALDPTLAPLLGEVAELKRVRSAQSGGRSLAEESFRRAWVVLLGGESADEVARVEIASALAQCALGAVDGNALADAKVAPADRRTVYRRAAERGFGRLSPALTAALDRAAEGFPPTGKPPHFVTLLCEQPRAGAVSEGAPRLVMSPEENHAEHCASVAVLAGLIELKRGREPGEAFLLGLAHHLPNAWLPDGGFAAEELLGTHLSAIFEDLTNRALQECPGPLAKDIRTLLSRRDAVSDPVGHAFNVADVADRVLQQRHYANLAGFSLSEVLGARELVHPGPLQAFQLDALERLGLTY